MAEPLYPLKNTLSGKTVRVPLGSYGDYVKSRDVGSGKFIWEPMGDVPGFRAKANGMPEAVIVPRNRVRDAVVGGDTMAYSLSRGLGDARHSIAVDESMEEAKRAVAKDRSGAMVFLDSGLSVATAGGTSALANWMAGEGSEEARGRSMRHHSMVHLAGRVAGIAALGAAPILGVLGRAAGAANAGSIFEVAGAVSHSARSLITGRGFASDFGKSIVGTLAYGAAAEAPLSAALAMADIVDNDKELSAEMFAAEAGQQFMWGMMIAGATGVPFAALGATLRAGARGAKKGAALIGQTDLMQGIVHGGTRYIARKHLRGMGRGAGDAVETMMHRVGGKAVAELSKENAKTGIGRWIAGDTGESFIRSRRTVQRAITDIGEAATERSMKEAAEVIGYNLRPGKLADDMAFIQKNAPDIVEARRFADLLPKQSAKILASASDIRFKAPKGARYIPQTKDILEDSLRSAAVLETGALQKTLANVSLPSNRAKAFAEALEMRRGLSDAGKIHVAKALRGVVVDSKTMGKMDDILAQMDGFDVFRHASEELAERLGQPKGLRSLEELEDLRASMQGMGGSYRGLVGEGVVRNPKGMRSYFDGNELRSRLKIDNMFDDFGPSIEALGRANNAFRELSFDARPLIAAKRPMTQTEILESELRTVISTKKRIWSALKYVAAKGGGGRHTVAFTGVMAFRQLNTAQEKREQFAVHRKALIEATASAGAMQAIVGKASEQVASYDMELGVGFAETLATANSYLLQQMPRTSDPAIGSAEFSSAEIENFLEAVGAIQDPISVLVTAVDGSVDSQGVDAIRTVYPSLYAEMIVDISEFLETHRGEMGHVQMLGLDAFTDGALGYADGPAPNLTFQDPAYQTTGQAQSAGAMGGPEHRRMNQMQNTTPAQKVGAM